MTDPRPSSPESSDSSSSASAASGGAPDLARRRFLGVVAGAGTCALGAALLAGPTTVVVAPAFSSSDDGAAGAWFRLGLAADFVVGAPPTRVVLRATTRDAWLVRENQPIGSVLVQRTADAEFRVFSAQCPHLGCAVDWQKDAERFVCPCHGAVFKDDGAPQPKLDGGTNPSPRALDTLEWRVTPGGQSALEVRWLRFRANVADKQPLGGA